jgi:hypothetical protein
MKYECNKDTYTIDPYFCKLTKCNERTPQFNTRSRIRNTVDINGSRDSSVDIGAGYILDARE